MSRSRKQAQAHVNNDCLEQKYWFFDCDTEVRLLVMDDFECENQESDEKLLPFYFEPNENEEFCTSIAMVTLNEFGKAELPDGWGKWEDARRLVNGHILVVNNVKQLKQ